jgi:GNAT superfamily N-acetyltransferase
MAADQKRRQKQLQRKQAKRKEKHRLLVKRKNRGLAEQLSEAAAKAPILHSFIAEAVWEEGLGNVLISRALPDNRVAMGCFLVDRYCLGVKDAFARILVKAEYQHKFLPHMEERIDLIEVEPATVRRLVEDSVEYARHLGFSPHEDYHRAKAIFGDIDPAAADEEFEFGQDGKPFFVSGPYDTPERCYRILSILEHSCGRDGFHYMMPLLDGVPDGLLHGARVIGPGEKEGEYVDYYPGDEEEDED